MSTGNLLQQAREKIRCASNPVSFSGAGLSAESGIATFRDGSDEGALWSKFDPMQLASQEGFAAAPETVIEWYNARRKTLSEALPNNAHKALAQQDNWVHITQNVDNLLEVAGADEGSVLHLHGTLLEDHCNSNCGYREKIDLTNSPVLRECRCGSYMRPSVVWFGEALPEAVLNSALTKSQAADLMLVVGTSAAVYPAAGLIDVAKENTVDVVVVNTEPSGEKVSGVIELIGPAGEILPELLGGSEPSGG